MQGGVGGKGKAGGGFPPALGGLWELGVRAGGRGPGPWVLSPLWTRVGAGGLGWVGAGSRRGSGARRPGLSPARGGVGGAHGGGCGGRAGSPEAWALYLRSLICSWHLGPGGHGTPHRAGPVPAPVSQPDTPSPPSPCALPPALAHPPTCPTPPHTHPSTLCPSTPSPSTSTMTSQPRWPPPSRISDITGGMATS